MCWEYGWNASLVIVEVVHPNGQCGVLVEAVVDPCINKGVAAGAAVNILFGVGRVKVRVFRAVADAQRTRLGFIDTVAGK